MTRWDRATHPRLCGRCGKEVHRGAPVFFIGISGTYGQPEGQATKSVLKMRCAACAGEPVPDDLAPLDESPAPTRFVKLPSGPGALPFDFKSAAAGREPGGDDD